MFTIEEIAAWCGGDWHGGLPAHTKILRIVHDTRTLRPGDLYVAVRGERFDGHAFIAEAFATGAIAVLAEAPSPDGPSLVVADTRKALLDLAAGYRQVLQAEVIAITGSAGKTTVKDMTAWVLDGDRQVGKSLGNWNNDIGMPLSLLAIPRHADAAVMELGMNHAGELSTLCEVVRPRVGCVTEIGLAHREYFTSEEAIAHEKATLLKALPEDGLAVVQLGRPWSDLLMAAPSCRIVTVALGLDADYTGYPAEREGWLVVNETASTTGAEYPLTMPGSYMMRNTLLVVALCRELGASPEIIAERLARFSPEGMRWKVLERHGRMIINDAYNANPLSMRASIEAFSEMPQGGRAWLLLGDMSELGDISEQEHRKLGEWLTTWNWHGVIGVGPRAKEIIDAVRPGFKGEVLAHFADAQQAGDAFIAASVPGDRMLIKGSRSMKLERALDV